jgi:uncharacterized protein (TIGR02284 family)
MSQKNSRTIELLNELIVTCKDGEKGYREASEGIENPFYRMMFSEYSRKRAKFASELQAQVVLLGGQPDRKGTVKGALHRGWMNLKNAIAGHNDDLIVDECSRGEDLAIKQYKDVLKQDLPAKLRSLLEHHMNEIIATQKRVKVMAKEVKR